MRGQRSRKPIGFRLWVVHGCRQIHFTDIENIYENNTKLFTMFPELKILCDEIKKNDINKVRAKLAVDIVLTGNPSEEEIMSIILPEGR